MDIPAPAINVYRITGGMARRIEFIEIVAEQQIREVSDCHAHQVNGEEGDDAHVESRDGDDMRYPRFTEGIWVICC